MWRFQAGDIRGHGPLQGTSTNWKFADQDVPTEITQPTATEMKAFARRHRESGGVTSIGQLNAAVKEGVDLGTLNDDQRAGTAIVGLRCVSCV